jgi:hypothetical protein
MNWSIAIKPRGDRSVLEDRFTKKFITVSPRFTWLMLAIRSFFAPAAPVAGV